MKQQHKHPAAASGDLPVGISLVISRADGQPLPEPIMVGGVAAQLILAIASHADEISAYAKGEVELHYGPGGVQARLYTLWEHTIDPDLLGQFSRTTPAVSPRAQRKRVNRAAPVIREVEIIVGNERAPWHQEQTG